MNHLSLFVLDDAQRIIIFPDAQYSFGTKTASGTNAFVEVAASVTNISCITQVTLKLVNYWSFVIMFIRRDYKNQIFATHFALRMV